MKYIVLLFSAIISFQVFAQAENDSVKSVDKADIISVTISRDDLTKLKSDNNALKVERDTLSSQYSALEKEYQKLKEDTVNYKDELRKLQQDVNQLKADTTTLYKQQREADKRLINIASNFLYIPYEDYSINEIAIPAFEAVTGEKWKQKYKVRYDLLCSFKKDIEDVMAFMEYVNSENGLGGHFGKHDTKTAAALREELHNKPFYQSYTNYKDWKETFLGIILVDIDNQLANYGQTNKVDFDKIKATLQACLDTVSVE